MGHDEAVRTRATEKYLLGELYPPLRDEFEEHLFDCRECALDFWAAATFLEHAKVVLSSRPWR
jgi:anti-sigma factor RsiW